MEYKKEGQRMKEFKMKKAHCPGCGAVFSYPVWDIINVEKHPDMKKKAADGSAFRTVCPHCGAPIILLYQFMYYDRKEKIIVAVGGDEKEPKEMKIWLWDHSREFEDYRKRAVSSINAFMEKLMIWNVGLNDKIIEILKAMAWQQLQEKDPNAADEILFSISSNHRPSFIFRKDQQLVGGFEIDNEAYEAAGRMAIPVIEEYSKDDLDIDMNWADRVIKKFE